MRFALRGFMLSAWYADAHTCQSMCDELLSCSKGSYCKSWQHIPVCFGLYYVAAGQPDMCYFPDDPTCPENYPVECPTDHAEMMELNSTQDPKSLVPSVQLDVETISLAVNETNSTLNELPTRSSNLSTSIEVFDWVVDNLIDGNSTTEKQS